MKIEFLSRQQALALSIAETHNNYAFLSISDTLDEMNEMVDNSNHQLSFFLTFLDVDDDTDGLNEQQALAIINFVEKCFKNKMNIIVHCFAGISRSGAIAKWVNDHYGLDDYRLNDYKLYNKHIYNMLMNLTSGVIDTSSSMFN